MADATVALDLGQTLDVQRNITAKIALDDDVVLIDILADLGFVLGREILDPDVRVDPGTGQDLVGRAAADAIHISQTNFDPLLARQINTSNTCHKAPP